MRSTRFSEIGQPMTDGGRRPADPSGQSVRWTRSAVRDLTNAREYLHLRDAKAARAFARGIRAAVDRTGRHPDSGPVADDLEPAGEYRHVVVPPYRVIYMLDDDLVVILRVWDSRRDPSALYL
jgi:toxin ParE1/3/4